MGRGINLSFVADVRQLLRGTSSVESALEDVGGALDQVVTDSAGAEAAMTADFTKIAAEAKASGDGVGKAYDDGSKKAAASSGKIKEGFHGTGDELKQEGLQGAASFDGSMSSAADSAQAFSSVALASFGPLGAAVGIAGAAALGALRANAAKAKAEVDKVFDALVSGQGKLDKAFAQSQLSDWAKDGTLKKLADQATDLGLSYDVAIRAALGQADAIAQVDTATQNATTTMTAQQAVLTRGGGAASVANLATKGLQRTAEGAATAIDKAGNQYELYAAATKAAGAATEDTTTALDDNVRSLKDIHDAALEARGMIRGVEQAYDDATDAAKTNGKTLDVTTQKGRDNAQALDDLASAIEADDNVSADEVRKWEKVATAMGLSQQAADDLAKSIGLIPDHKVKVTLDVKAAQRQLARLSQGNGAFKFDPT